MKIGIQEIHEALHEIALQKLKRSLNKEGFTVDLDYKATVNSKEIEVDLFAKKGDERRIYEVKIGKNKISKAQFEKLHNIANLLRAKLFVTYLEEPRTKAIEYEKIDEMLLEYLENNIPSEIDVLSTHTTINSIDSVDITSIKLSDKGTVIEGNAVLCVDLQYGSNLDLKDDFGDETSDSFDFFFRLRVVDEEITNSYFKFDLEHFYK